MAGSNRLDTNSYDVVIAGRGYMLAQDPAADTAAGPGGKMIWKQERMKYAPSAPSPEAEPYNITPNYEVPQVFTNWRNGIGFREQPQLVSKDTNGIFYGRYMDKCSIYLGPSAAVTAFTPGTTDTVNGGNQFVEYPLLNAAPAAPTLSTGSSGGTLTAGTYQVEVTYVGADGETAASSATSQAISGVQTLIITSPAATTAPFAATGWYAYVTTAGGSTFKRQQTAGSPTAIGTNLTLTADPTTTGATAPSSGTHYTRVLFCAMGRYLLQRNSDTSWTNVGPGASNDLGAGAKITSLCVYRGQQTSNFLMVAWQDSSATAQNYYVWDGTTWTQMSNAAVDFVRYRDEVWMLSQDSDGRWQVQKDITGGTAAVWGGGFVVADAIDTCRHLIVQQDRLFIRSTKGLLGVNNAENDAQEITGDAFKNQYKSLNDCRPVSFNQFVVSQISDSFFAYDPQQGTTSEIGVNVIKNNDSIATGIHTTAAPYKFWTMYTWTYNANNTTAYLWRWGEHELIDTLYSPVPFQEILPCLYGSLYEQTAQVNGSLVSAIGGATPRLYWTDAVGAISFMPLSRHNTNPYSDTAVPANTTNAFEVYLPAVTSRNNVEKKVTSGIGIVNKNCNTSNFLTVSYRTDQTSTFGGSANLDNGGQYQTPVSGRNDFSDNNEPQTAWLELKISGTNTSTSSPPLLETVVAYQIIRPVMKWVYTGVLLISDYVKSRTGADRARLFSVSDDLTFLSGLAGAAGCYDLTTPDGSTAHVMVTNLAIELQRREPLFRPEYYVTIEMTEHRQTSSRGTYARLNPFTYSFLENYTYQILENL